MVYGAPPENLGLAQLDWDEYMHYMYLPIYMGSPRGEFYRRDSILLPRNLEFAWPLIERAITREFYRGGQREYGYMYITARRGYATPGNPLNRPGWHTDGFGTNDVNYVWTDKFPTQFAIQDFGEISDDHIESAKQFTERVRPQSIALYPPYSFLRLTPAVVHAAPEINEGGERGFIKISFSNDCYNLKGNSHNYLFDYDWQMWDRDVLRNDPAYAGKDVGPQ